VVDVAIKQRGKAEQVVEIIRDADAPGRVTVVSFDREDLRAAKAAEPSLACGLITSGPDEDETERALIASALECGASFLSCSHRSVTPTLVRECHLVGLTLMAWTMDEPEDIRRMIGLQVDALVSNHPERAIEMLEG